MNHRSARQILALCLGVLLVLGVSLSAVQASEMAFQMAMAADSGASGQDDCDGCGNDGASAVTCSVLLNCSSITALLPPECGLAAAAPAGPVVPVSSVARDLTVPPDPYPPRSLDLG